MKITHDAAADTLTVVLGDAPTRISEDEKSGVILDYDADDRLIAIEILDASARVDTVQLQVIPKPGAKASRGGVTRLRHCADVGRKRAGVSRGLARSRQCAPTSRESCGSRVRWVFLPLGFSFAGRSALGSPSSIRSRNFNRFAPMQLP